MCKGDQSEGQAADVGWIMEKPVDLKPELLLGASESGHWVWTLCYDLLHGSRSRRQFICVMIQLSQKGKINLMAGLGSHISNHI